MAMRGQRLNDYIKLALVFSFAVCCESVNILSKDNLHFKFINFFHKPGLALIDSLVANVNVTDLTSCQIHCVDHKDCLSINFGNKTNHNDFVCELNNSTSLAKPDKVRRRKGFEFYGPADPCFSNPCLNGGTCISNTSDNTYRCNCGLAIPTLPYLNDNCAIGKTISRRFQVYKNVFIQIINKTYSLNYYEAQRVCEIFGARLANLNQLTAAWKTGYDKCSYGWLIDGTLRYPIFYQRYTMGCGGLGPPSIVGSSAPRNKDHDKSCAYCHRDTDQCNEENWHQNDLKCFKFFLDTKASWDDASRTCAQEGGNLGVFGRKGGLHFVTDFVQSRNKSNEQIMVGLRQDESRGWKWVDGTSVASSLWNLTAPNGTIGTINLRLISLDNVPDTQLLPFVCEKDLP
ncbi:uncharacterized protein LOC110249510 [Exaiptasia diaphana]|uniref:Uncharacterized protein n=1 Tax=Exaiptasia diaphana TaxID=2652724 RepID=A0A913XZJ7_EXADI|nr:uncharacterized protein LOC110249510 [Exaiptasia diaphana]